MFIEGLSFKRLFKLLISPIFNKSQRSKTIQIYTDGSHKDKWGSWAFVIVKNGKIIREEFGRVRKTNSLRMEFQAAIEALQSLPKEARAEIYTDSQILLNSRRDQDFQPDSNSDQSILLDSLELNREVSWKWVKAHSGNRYNERCDELCDLARELV